MKFSFTKVGVKDNGRDDWGVRCVADQPGAAIVFAGQDVEVTKRDGSSRDVTLGDLLDAKDAGKTATYSLQRRENGNTGGPSAAEAIVKIAMELAAKSWSRSTLDRVADIVTEYGLPVTKPPVKKPAAKTTRKRAA